MYVECWSPRQKEIPKSFVRFLVERKTTFTFLALEAIVNIK